MATRTTDALDAAAWVEAAFAMLVDTSIEKIGVEPLAKRLGVTKGSFYWHFKDREALHRAILQTWRQRATLNIIDRLEHSHLTPTERLRQLVELPAASPKARSAALVELAIRAWARRDDVAAQAVAEIDEQRLTYLSALFRQLGMAKADADARAFLLYGSQLAESMIATGGDRKKKERMEAIANVLLGGR